METEPSLWTTVHIDAWKQHTLYGAYTAIFYSNKVLFLFHSIQFAFFFSKDSPVYWYRFVHEAKFSSTRNEKEKTHEVSFREQQNRKNYKRSEKFRILAIIFSEILFKFRYHCVRRNIYQLF